jgi:hypothetical protein
MYHPLYDAYKLIAPTSEILKYKADGERKFKLRLPPSHPKEMMKRNSFK